MSVMAKPKKPAAPDQGGGRSGENLNVWVRSALVTALRAYLAHTRPRTTKTAVVEEALEAFLREKGFWPSSQPEEGQP